jgi:hypothetical protein
MGHVLPFGIPFDFREQRVSTKGLNPPAASTFGIQDDPLFRANANHPSLDVVHVVQTAYSRHGNLSEFNGRPGTAFLGMATLTRKVESQSA